MSILRTFINARSGGDVMDGVAEPPLTLEVAMWHRRADLFAPQHYSALRAAIGFTSAARRAGRYPAAADAVSTRPQALNHAVVSNEVTRYRTECISRAVTNPPSSPPARPIIAGTRAVRMARVTMRHGFAPSAARIDISRCRWITDCAMTL